MIGGWLATIALIWLLCGLISIVYLYYRYGRVDTGDALLCIFVGTVGTLLIVGGFIHRQYKRL